MFGDYICSNHRIPVAHYCDGGFSLQWRAVVREKLSGEFVPSRSEFDAPEPSEPKHTVGTWPQPEYESSPDFEMKTIQEDNQSESKAGFITRFRKRLIIR